MRAFLFATNAALYEYWKIKLDCPARRCFLFQVFYVTYKYLLSYSYFLKQLRVKLPRSCFITNWKFVLNALKGADFKAQGSCWLLVGNRLIGKWQIETRDWIAENTVWRMGNASQGKSQKSCEICIRLSYKFVCRHLSQAKYLKNSHDKCCCSYHW